MKFVLLPFSNGVTKKPAVPFLSGSIQRDRQKLGIAFTDMTLPHVNWPASASIPERQHNLWQSTCFECFVGLEDEKTYLEINASPSGHWQVYEFSDYRQNVGTPSQVTINIKPHSHHAQKSFHLHIDIAHPEFVTKNWRISVSAILEREQTLEYYALGHPENAPDFHLSKLRALDLPATALDNADLPPMDIS